ncbi:MAG: hypothetical protein PVG39_11390 [Desulfobacteraceae bacterium]|jgi:hypothetical protein
MKKLFIILFCFLMTGCATRPFKNWTKEDTQRQIVYTVEHAVDWMQTKQIAKNPGKYKEIGLPGVFYGEHPSTSEVDFFFASTLLIQTAIPAMLKPKYRKWYQMIWIGLETGTVFRNFSLGLHGEF